MKKYRGKKIQYVKYRSDFGHASFKWRDNISERCDIYFQNSNYKTGGGRKRCLCLRELKWASHRASGSDSNNTLQQPMLAWAANKWGLGINPVISHSVSTLFSRCLSEGGIAGGSGLPVLPHWAHLGVCVYFLLLYTDCSDVSALPWGWRWCCCWCLNSVFWSATSMVRVCLQTKVVGRSTFWEIHLIAFTWS